MTDDPVRILQSDDMSEAGSLERQLLGSLSPTEQDRQRIRGRVLAQGAALVVAGTLAQQTTAAAQSAAATQAAAAAQSAVAASGLASASGAVASLGVKAAVWAALAVPVLGGALYFGLNASPEEAPLPARSSRVEGLAPVVPQETKTNETAEPSEEQDTERETEVGRPAQPRRTAALKASAESSLLKEDRLLRTARAAWKAGDSERALSALAELDRQFPRGALLQEREVLRIAVLRQRGKTTAADDRSTEFKKRYPDSPYEGDAKSGQAAGEP